MEENLRQQQTSILKIAIYGPESTGKTTLAKQLAAHFNTVWTPEFAREYLQQKWDRSQEVCTLADMMPIALGQTQLENEKLALANTFLFCDTNVLVTKVYSDIYYKTCEPELEKAAFEHHYDLFFLTDVDIPWQKDDLRDSAQYRDQSFQVFKETLIAHNKPYILLSGNQDTRLEKAISILLDLKKAYQIGFTSNDFVQMYQHGINCDAMVFQHAIISNGLPKIQLDRPAQINDGIIAMNEIEATQWASFFDHHKHEKQLLKFVPASGAATRMFKFLNEFLNEYDSQNESINAYINRKKDKNLPVFLMGIEKLSFYNDIIDALQKSHSDFQTWSVDKKHYSFIKQMIAPTGFNFANKPKGVLPFHKYPDKIVTAIEEHLNECVTYAQANNQAAIEFTVSEEHQDAFENIVNRVKPSLEQQNNLQIKVSYSYQKKTTDTVAFTTNGTPFREANNALLFRPGGHGALIENLNEIHADIVFIKNIDNVLQNHKQQIALYKKALAGKLLQTQQRVFSYLTILDNTAVTNEQLQEMTAYIFETLKMTIAEDFTKFTKEYKIEHLKSIFNRPMRVCGMVKNEGEPGGGPFWVRDKKGNVFLQIVEASQIEAANMVQQKIMKSATHFNPVDLVCGLKDYKGNKFNLLEFTDPNSGFVVQKNKGGKELVSYELPGLWNGAMSKWLTLFVEVPLLTFNPVKTVNDLLKPAHQP
jgi:nicotinamide riboside kinase